MPWRFLHFFWELLAKKARVCYNKENLLHILYGGDFMKKLSWPTARACLTVDLSRLVANYRYLAARLAREGTEPIAVVKANAYGHGDVAVAAALYGAGCRRFAVATLAEALSLRAALPPCEILTLGYTPPECARTAAEGGITLTVGELSYAKTISRLLGARELSVHIKLNSGMNRTGLRLAPESFDRSMAAVCEILRLPSLRVRGIYSHLACADIPASCENTRAIRSFFAARTALSRAGIALPMHLSASAAVLSGALPPLPLARLGLSLYGYDPMEKDKYLLPIARLSSPIVQIYPIARGEYVGYGAAYRAARREVVGILPIGYADGLFRASANGGAVWVGEHRAPFIGRISMDSAAISLRGILRADCKEAVIFGKTPADLPLLARAAGTITYELLAGLGQRIDRKYEYGNAIGDHCTE